MSKNDPIGRTLMNKILISWLSALAGAAYSSTVWAAALYKIDACIAISVIAGIMLSVCIAAGFKTALEERSNEKAKANESDIIFASLTGLVVGAAYASLVWGSVIYRNVPCVVGAVLVGIALLICFIISFEGAITQER